MLVCAHALNQVLELIFKQSQARFENIQSDLYLQVFFTDSANAWDPTPDARRRLARALHEV